MVMVPPMEMTVEGVNTTLTAPEVTLLPTVSAATIIIGVTLLAKNPDGYDSCSDNEDKEARVNFTNNKDKDELI